jgi:proteasome lid subunit RPN8/RPN11
MITLAHYHLDEISAHGERDYPHECCGLLIGNLFADGRKIVRETYPLSNSREEEERHHRLLILPEEYMRGDRYALRQGLDVVGYYHSHPDHPAKPSQYDLDHAPWSTWSYIIVSVQQGSAVDLRSWQMRSDRSQFDEEEITKGD